MNRRLLVAAVLAVVSVGSTVHCVSADAVSARWCAVVPDRDVAAWRRLATDWLTAIGEADLRIVQAEEALATPNVGTVAQRTLVMRHAGVNALLARWYARGLDSTDTRFPGADGWVLRWLPRTDETGPALVAGAESAADLAATRSAFLEVCRQTVPSTAVHLSPRWQRVAERERVWWASFPDSTRLNWRRDDQRMATRIDASMQFRPDAELTTWRIWMQRMCRFSFRIAEGAHATADPTAIGLYRWNCPRSYL